MQVVSTGPQTIRKAEGENITLGCSYTPSPSDTGELDIEWSVISPDTTQKDQMLLSYTKGTVYIHENNALTKELSFATRDPSMGDASLSVAVLSLAHSATYKCKVKKSPGVDMRKVSLVVMAKPSIPKCRVEGEELVGKPVSLHCNSAKGSAPLKYMWRRESADPIPATATQDSVTGELRISNHSRSFAGIYLCEVNNAVGTEHCRINLKAVSGKGMHPLTQPQRSFPLTFAWRPHVIMKALDFILLKIHLFCCFELDERFFFGSILTEHPKAKSSSHWLCWKKILKQGAIMINKLVAVAGYETTKTSS
uniref:Ig-like domain-containing protein n=1 Tax=Mastacembelus armatus TaxID=205130 RepID=A0A3Q3KVD1_9TELE